MSAAAAKEEFDELVRDKDQEARHPEDRNDSDRDEKDHDDDEPKHHSESTRHTRGRGNGKEHDSSDDDEAPTRPSGKMAAVYQAPAHFTNANTGPKGVIADAQAFEEAKRAAAVVRKTQAAQAAWLSNGNERPARRRGSDQNKHNSEDDSEEGESFMARWRQNRLRELQSAGNMIGKGLRAASPSRRTYGKLATVDCDGYLDAIEKVPSDTVVVVLIYDDNVSFTNESPTPNLILWPLLHLSPPPPTSSPLLLCLHHAYLSYHALGASFRHVLIDIRTQSERSVRVEDCVRKLARQHATTRFVRLHFEEAEMEPAGVPSILAYRRGEKFAGLVPVLAELRGEECTERTLEAALKR